MYLKKICECHFIKTQKYIYIFLGDNILQTEKKTFLWGGKKDKDNEKASKSGEEVLISTQKPIQWL